MTGSQVLLLAHCFSTLFMTGLIWFVQVVHYPLFARVGEPWFEAYEQAHTRRTTWVVLPVMMLELATGIALLVFPPAHVDYWQLGVGLGLLAAIWASTFLIQVPLHNKLTRGFDPRAHRWLVRSNWLRTVLWTLRALLVLSWL